jgi:hypothetical protein
MPAVETPADIVGISFLEQSGGFRFSLHVGTNVIVKHQFDAFFAKELPYFVEAAREVSPFMGFQLGGRIDASRLANLR